MPETTIKDVIAYFHSIAPFNLQEPYDNSGLIVGNPQSVVRGVMVSLDATEEVILEAAAKNCNLVISHHPIVFSGIKRLTGAHYVERAVISAIKNDVALLAIHTNLDNVLEKGVNGMIASKLELQAISPLMPKENEEINSTVGSGCIGKLKSPMPTMEFLKFLKKTMQTSVVKYTDLVKKDIRTVAVCGGSGSFLLEAAKSSGADIFITSDYKYHEYFEANGEIIIADIGHYESEQFTIPLIHNLLTQKFSTFASHYTELSTNPVKYL